MDELFLFSEWLDGQGFMVGETEEDQRTHELLVTEFRMTKADYDNPLAYAEWLQEQGLLSDSKGYLPSAEELANQFEAFRRFA